MTPLLPVSMSLVVSKTPALFKICSPHAQEIYYSSSFSRWELEVHFTFLGFLVCFFSFTFFTIHLLSSACIYLHLYSFVSNCFLDSYTFIPSMASLRGEKECVPHPQMIRFHYLLRVPVKVSFPENFPFTFIGGVAVVRLFKYCSLQQ